VSQPTGNVRKVLRRLLLSLLTPGFGLMLVLKSIGWMIDGKAPNILEMFNSDSSSNESVRELRELMMADRQLSPVTFWITVTVNAATGFLLLTVGVSDWIAPWYRRKKDRRFYDSLGSEDTTSQCSRSGCHSGTVRNSHLCKRHYFERHTARECPFEH
jgi:ketosteroid isomerase-like protein